MAVVAKSVEVVLPRIHSLVVGPGLGRNPFVLECAKHVITAAMELNLPIVIDADGILAPHTHSAPAAQLAHRGAVSVPPVPANCLHTQASLRCARTRLWCKATHKPS